MFLGIGLGISAGGLPEDLDLPLSAGTASLTSVSYDSALLICTAPSGGTGPYTYQWERRTIAPVAVGWAELVGEVALDLTDEDLDPETEYEWRCVQTDAELDSVTSNVINATTDAAPVVVGAVTDLAGTGNLDSSVDLTWTDAVGATEYQISEGATLLGTIAQGIGAFTVPPPAPTGDPYDPGAEYELMAADDFDNDSWGDFTPGGHTNSNFDTILAVDPTGIKDGAVLRLRYEDDDGSGSDIERHFSRSFAAGVFGPGSEMIAQGHYYVYDNGVDCNRKITRFYIGPQGSGGSDFTMWEQGNMRIEGPSEGGFIWHNDAPLSLPKENWYFKRWRLKLNTAVGVADGEFDLWINGQLQYALRDLELINSTYNYVGPVRFGVQTHSTRIMYGEVPDVRLWHDARIYRRIV
jgi:hypothetical protein